MGEQNLAVTQGHEQEIQVKRIHIVSIYCFYMLSFYLFEIKSVVLKSDKSM